MMRFKHFVGSGPELDQMINHWLADYEPDVTHVVQSTDGDTIIVSFLFDESFRSQEQRMSEERGMTHATIPAVPSDTIPDKPVIVPQEPGMLSTEAH
jgi:hypothetical protein